MADTTSITAINDGTVSRSSAVNYATARNTADGNGTDTTNLYVGQKTSEAQVYRSFLSFPIPSLESADACTLYINGATDASTTDFIIYINLADNYNTIGTGDYDAFDGWTSGSAHTGTILNDSWNSSSYSAAWNIIVFNSSGLSQVEGANTDTLHIALISKEDYDNSEPSNDEYIIFDSSSDSGTEPYLSLDYTPNDTSIQRKQKLYNITSQKLYDKQNIPLYKP